MTGSRFTSSFVPGLRSRHAQTSKILIAVAAMVLFLLLLRYYLKTPSELAVLQMRAGRFHPDLLMEKQPVLIEDRVYDVSELARTALKYYYVYLRVRDVRLTSSSADSRSEKKDGSYAAGTFVDTYAVATFVSPHRLGAARGTGNADVKVKIRASSLRRKNRSVDFLLHPCQVLVLPPHWRVSVPPEPHKERRVKVRVAEAYDTLHAMLVPAFATARRLWQKETRE